MLTTFSKILTLRTYLASGRDTIAPPLCLCFRRPRREACSMWAPNRLPEVCHRL